MFRVLRSIIRVIPVVVVSGFREDSRISEMVQEKGVIYIQKPYTMDQLAEAFSKILSGPSHPEGDL